MPRKIYEDKRLKPEALRLRRQGLSYREIAEKLSYSVYKVHELISEHESPSSRLKQAAELADKLDGLASKLNALDTQVSKLQSFLSNVKMLRDLTGGVSKLRKEVESIDRRLKELADSINWIRTSAERRLREDYDGCKWLDGSGYCICWLWHEKVRGWNMKPDIEGGKNGLQVEREKASANMHSVSILRPPVRSYLFQPLFSANNPPPAAPLMADHRLMS